MAMVDQMMHLVASPAMPLTYSAIVSHFLFEYIHPFYDGNGRTGRYLLALYLSEPLSKPTVLSLSRVIAENKGKYYKAFDITERSINHAEVTFFVLQVMELIRLAQDSLIENLELKKAQLERATECMEALASKHELSETAAVALFAMTQFYLFGAFPEISLHEVAEHAMVSVQTARKYMRDLEKKGLVTVVSKRPLKFTLSKTTAEFLEIPAV